MHTNPEVLALVALGERDAASAEELDHIARCAACGQEVTDLGHLSQVGRTISDHFTLETPSPEVWDRIRAQLGFDPEFSSDLVPAPDLVPPDDLSSLTPLTPTRPLSVVRSTGDDEVPGPERLDQPRPNRRRVLSLALAAVLALLAGIGGTLAWQHYADKDTVVSSAPLQALPAWSGAQGTATLEEDAAGNKVLVISMVTPRPVDGIQQVWLADATATDMTPIGPLSQPAQRFPLPKDLDVSRFPVIDISVQQPGGDPAHSGNSIVRGTLPV
jgi:hypothetical protein